MTSSWKFTSQIKTRGGKGEGVRIPKIWGGNTWTTRLKQWWAVLSSQAVSAFVWSMSGILTIDLGLMIHRDPVCWPRETWRVTFRLNTLVIVSSNCDIRTLLKLFIVCITTNYCARKSSSCHVQWSHDVNSRCILTCMGHRATLKD